MKLCPEKVNHVSQLVKPQKRDLVAETYAECTFSPVTNNEKNNVRA